MLKHGIGKKLTKDYIESLNVKIEFDNNGVPEFYHFVNNRWVHLKKGINNFGYQRISFSENGKSYSLYVHRAVYAWCNEVLEDFVVIDHKNAIRTDNRLTNLRPVVSQENTAAVGVPSYIAQLENRIEYLESLLKKAGVYYEVR